MLEVDCQTFFCGPLRVSLLSDDAALSEKVAQMLCLYGVRWLPPYHDVCLEVFRSEGSDSVSGSYLSCARMLVDAAPSGLRAESKSGAFADSVLRDKESFWRIGVPPDIEFAPPVVADIEDLVGLALTTGWRLCGYVPFHGAGVVRGETCAMISAHSGGGKSTLTAALIRRGWRTLGDDKMLLAFADGRPRIAALVKTFNLHPQTRQWFPEVGDLESLQTYSAWTDKRRVPVDGVWPEAIVERATPTHFVQLDRNEEHAGITVAPMRPADVLPHMLAHVVIPSDERVARATLATVAAAAACIRGLRVTVGKHAYRDPQCLEALEEAMR